MLILKKTCFIDIKKTFINPVVKCRNTDDQLISRWLLVKKKSVIFPRNKPKTKPKKPKSYAII